MKYFVVNHDNKTIKRYNSKPKEKSYSAIELIELLWGINLLEFKLIT